MDEKLKALWTQVKVWAAAFWARLNADLAKLWAEDRVFLIAFGAIILTIKFHSALINLIVSNAKSIFNKSTQEATVLQAQENADNSAANALVQDASKLSSAEQPITEDWYTKK